MGALADSVKEVLELETDRIDPPPAHGRGGPGDCIRGIGKHGNRFLLVLDVDRVFSSEEILDLAQVLGESSRPRPGLKKRRIVSFLVRKRAVQGGFAMFAKRGIAFKLGLLDSLCSSCSPLPSPVWGYLGLSDLLTRSAKMDAVGDISDAITNARMDMLYFMNSKDIGRKESFVKSLAKARENAQKSQTHAG